MQLIIKRKNINQRDAQSTFNIDEGSVITENYNETLDSATIRVSQIPNYVTVSGRRIVVNQLIFDLEPYDKVVLHDELSRIPDKYMCVDTITKTMENLEGYNTTYTFEISLFSETKGLEGVVLPNLSITQLKNGTHRSIWTYLTRYLVLYSPTIRIYDEDPNVGYDTVHKYSFKSGIETKFNIDCPEMQWNNPTLREVLTDLMMVVDCIPVVRNNVIDYIDLTEKKTDISQNSHINYIQSSQSSEDYVSELKMDMQNVMQTSIEGVNDSCSRVEYLTFRAEGDGYVANSDNVVLNTFFPILNIKHLWMVFESAFGNRSNFKRTYFKVDLCNLELTNGQNKKLVYEKTEYSTLPQRRYNPTNFNEINQNISLYFTRGGKEIEGFTNLSRMKWTFNGRISALEILKGLIRNNCYDVNGESIADHPAQTQTTIGADNIYYSTFFQIEYETTTDSVFTASKDIAPSNQRVVADNQTNSYVDAYNQGFMEYQKANRLGNKQLHINARYEEVNNDLIKIGDYYDDSIVYQTQYQIYENHIEVNALATKDYILRDYFTGVKARIRSWKIADGNDALTTHELQKWYLEFSFSEKDEFYISFDKGEDLTWYFSLVFLDGDEANPIKYAVCSVYAGNTLPDSTHYFCCDLVSRIIGNSIVFNFGFVDNFSAGKNVAEITINDIDPGDVDESDDNVHPHMILTPASVKKSFTDNYGGVPLKDIRYVDEYGECNVVSYKLVTNIRSYSSDIDDSGSWTDQDRQQFFYNNTQKIVVYDKSVYNVVGDIFYWNYIRYEGTRTVFKDNREILKISTQFEFCSDTHDIFFTRKFLELQSCIRNTAISTYSIKVYRMPTDYYDYKNYSESYIMNHGTLVSEEMDVDNFRDGNSLIQIMNLNLPSGATVNNSAFYIFVNNNVILGLNKHSEVYLNLLRSRNYNIYDTEGNIIDTI